MFRRQLCSEQVVQEGSVLGMPSVFALKILEGLKAESNVPEI